MKRLYIVVEGQTEQEFVNTVLAPYFISNQIYSITPILIRTSKSGRGGFVNYEHLKNTVNGLLQGSVNNDFVVSTFVDFFRIPNNIPTYEACMNIQCKRMQTNSLEQAINNDIADRRFFSYIQLHEFEALLFSSNKGFESYYSDGIHLQTKEIVDKFDNPEDIKTDPNAAPSKRILSIHNKYEKIIEGNLIALEIGIDTILNRCPHFKDWVNELICRCKGVNA